MRCKDIQRGCEPGDDVIYQKILYLPQKCSLILSLHLKASILGLNECNVVIHRLGTVLSSAMQRSQGITYAQMYLVGRNQAIHHVKFGNGFVQVFHHNGNAVVGLKE